MPTGGGRDTSGRQQIGPRILPETRAMLEDACRERHCSVSELVEQALQAFLTPVTEDEALHQLVIQQREILDTVQDMQGLLQQFLTLLGALPLTQASAPAAPPERLKIATYAEMYGPIESAQAPDGGAVAVPPATTPSPAAVGSSSGRLRRWLFREERP